MHHLHHCFHVINRSVLQNSMSQVENMTGSAVCAAQHIVALRPAAVELADRAMIDLAKRNALALSAGHCFIPADTKSTHGVGADYDASGVTVEVCVENCETGFRSGISARTSPSTS